MSRIRSGRDRFSIRLSKDDLSNLEALTFTSEELKNVWAPQIFTRLIKQFLRTGAGLATRQRLEFLSGTLSKLVPEAQKLQDF
jgi:hypothetical protein